VYFLEAYFARMNRAQERVCFGLYLGPGREDRKLYDGLAVTDGGLEPDARLASVQV